jgi:hypothetical protein
MLMKLIPYFLWIVIVFTLVSCDETRTIISDKNPGNVLYSERLKDDLYLIFFTEELNNSYVLGYEVAEKSNNKWIVVDKSSGPSIPSQELLAFDIASIAVKKESRLGLIYGVLSERGQIQIKNIIVNHEIDVKVINNPSFKIWFALTDPNSLKVPGLHIEAYGFNGERLYTFQ